MLKLNRLLYALFIVLPTILNAETCIVAADFGLGGVTTVYANPNEDSSLATNSIPSGGGTVNSKLLRIEPRGYQVAPWTDTQLYTTGIAAGSSNISAYFTILKGYVTGQWYPYGYQSKNDCNLTPCDPSKTRDNVCLDGGIKVNDNIEDDSIVYPCALKSGLGLYGMVALTNNGETLDPNDLNNAVNLPLNAFRTFHLYPLQNGRADQQYFELTSLQQCINDHGKLVCQDDLDTNGLPYIPKGKLYFKISDSYYEDNSGFYSVSLVSGVYIPKGWIQELIDQFKLNLNIVTTKIYNSLSQSTYFIKICQALLVFYTAITGIMFMLGLIRTHYYELILRLFRIGLVVTLISPSSWYFFNTYLFQAFTSGAETIATDIVNLTLYDQKNYNNSMFLLPENANALAVFDNFFRLLISRPVHWKILSMVFYDWHFLMIPFIYVGLYFLITGIIKAVMMYLLAIIQMALLLVAAPIFIIMILFQLTKGLFDEWIRRLIASSLVIIIVFSTIALLMSLILEQLQQLLYYDICWESVFSDTITGKDLFDVYFWCPTSPSQVSNALTVENYFSFLIVCVIFESFIKEIPTLTDALSAASRPTISTSFQQFESTAKQSALFQAPYFAKGFGKAVGGGVMPYVAKIPIIGTGIGTVTKAVGTASAAYSRVTGAVSEIGKKFEGEGSLGRGSVNFAAPVKGVSDTYKGITDTIIPRK